MRARVHFLVCCNAFLLCSKVLVRDTKMTWARGVACSSRGEAERRVEWAAGCFVGQSSVFLAAGEIFALLREALSGESVEILVLYSGMPGGCRSTPENREACACVWQGYLISARVLCSLSLRSLLGGRFVRLLEQLWPNEARMGQLEH